jgi:hypothetical protein
MKAVELQRTRIVFSETVFAEMVVWPLTEPVTGSAHAFKYRLAYIVGGERVLRYDNETGKGDHRHYGSKEGAYKFATIEKLIADFQRDIARWNDENGNS